MIQPLPLSSHGFFPQCDIIVPISHRKYIPCKRPPWNSPNSGVKVNKTLPSHPSPSPATVHIHDCRILWSTGNGRFWNPRVGCPSYISYLVRMHPESRKTVPSSDYHCKASTLLQCYHSHQKQASLLDQAVLHWQGAKAGAHVAEVTRSLWCPNHHHFLQ